MGPGACPGLGNQSERAVSSNFPSHDLLGLGGAPGHDQFRCRSSLERAACPATRCHLRIPVMAAALCGYWKASTGSFGSQVVGTTDTRRCGLAVDRNLFWVFGHPEVIHFLALAVLRPMFGPSILPVLRRKADVSATRHDRGDDLHRARPSMTVWGPPNASPPVRVMLAVLLVHWDVHDGAGADRGREVRQLGLAPLCRGAKLPFEQDNDVRVRLLITLPFLRGYQQASSASAAGGLRGHGLPTFVGPTSTPRLRARPSCSPCRGGFTSVER